MVKYAQRVRMQNESMIMTIPAKEVDLLNLQNGDWVSVEITKIEQKEVNQNV